MPGATYSPENMVLYIHTGYSYSIIIPIGSGSGITSMSHRVTALVMCTNYFQKCIQKYSFKVTIAVQIQTEVNRLVTYRDIDSNPILGSNTNQNM